MAIADDLDTAFDQYLVKSNAQGFMLRRLAGSFSDGFAAYVGASPNVWTKEDGKAGGARVRLGEGNADNFEPRPWPHIPTSLGAVKFSISYTLSSRDHGKTYTFVFGSLLSTMIASTGFHQARTSRIGLTTSSPPWLR